MSDKNIAATPTRADYLEGRCTHAEYYGAICRDAGIHYSPDHHLVTLAREALAAGDEHLNRISLGVWDRQSPRPIPSALAEAFRSRGDYATPAGLVCVHKQAVREAVRRP
jgi:hypothetical protein